MRLHEDKWLFRETFGVRQFRIATIKPERILRMQLMIIFPKANWYWRKMIFGQILMIFLRYPKE